MHRECDGTARTSTGAVTRIYRNMTWNSLRIWRSPTVKDDDTSSASYTMSSSSPFNLPLTTGVQKVQIQWFLDPPLLMILLLSLPIMFALMVMSLITISLYKDPVMEILPLCLDFTQIMNTDLNVSIGLVFTWLTTFTHFYKKF